MNLPDIGRKIRVLAIHHSDQSPTVRVGEEVTVKLVDDEGNQIYLETHDDGRFTWITDWEYVEEPELIRMNLPDIGRKIRVLAIHPEDTFPSVKAGEEVEIECAERRFSPDRILIRRRGDFGHTWVTDWEYADEPECPRDEPKAELKPGPPYVYAPGQRAAEAKFIEIDSADAQSARLHWVRLSADAHARWARIEAAAQERDAAFARGREAGRAEVRPHLDAVAAALHPHWRGVGHTYHPEQLAGMVDDLAEARDESRDEIARLEKVVEAANRMKDQYIMVWQQRCKAHLLPGSVEAYDEARAALYATKQDSPPSPENTFAGSARISVQSGAQDDGGSTALEQQQGARGDDGNAECIRRLDDLAATVRRLLMASSAGYIELWNAIKALAIRVDELEGARQPVPAYDDRVGGEKARKP